MVCSASSGQLTRTDCGYLPQLYIQKHHVGSLKSVMTGVFTTEISKHHKSWLVSFFLKGNYYALIGTPLAIVFNSNLGTTFKPLLTQAPNKRIFSVLSQRNETESFIYLFFPHIYMQILQLVKDRVVTDTNHDHAFRFEINSKYSTLAKKICNKCLLAGFEFSLSMQKSYMW